MFRLAISFICLSLFSAVQAQKNLIIPAPVSVIQTAGSFTISTKTEIIISNEDDRNTANFLQHYVMTFYGLKLKINFNKPAVSHGAIVLTNKKNRQVASNAEAYDLIINAKGIKIEGNSAAGTFYGMQSLIQLLPVKKQTILQVPFTTVKDLPRFGYRGMHLDVSRHFFPPAYIKKYIDFLALHKMNRFHWHLTDDQGWRIEIKKYPLLTTVGGYRNGTIIGRYPGTGNDSLVYGGFYTQDEIKEVVRYAASRFIEVIPEIEMPGHSSAAIAAYPYLSCFPEEATKAPAGTAWSGPKEGKQVQQAWGVFDDVYCAGNEQTFSFLQDVLDEVMPLFPNKYVHVGGDENPKGNWKRCLRCQQRIRENKLKDEHELQSYFIQRIEKYVNSKGKSIIGWDEILEGGLAPNATVMSWRGEEGGMQAANQKHNAIMTPEPYLYFNWSQTRMEDSVSFGRYTPIEKVYNYNPIPAKLDSENIKYILGAQGNLWTEYIKNTNILEYNLFPRISALSELAWSKKKDYANFEQRLLTQIKRYELWKVNYSKAYFEINYTIKPTYNYEGLAISFDNYKFKDLVTILKDTIVAIPVYNLKGDKTDDSATVQNKITFKDSVVIKQGGDYHFVSADSSKGFHYDAKVSFAFNKATAKKISLKTAASSTYPGNGGAFGLVNGLSGKNFNAKEWQGWNGKDMEAVIDFRRTETITVISLGVWNQEPSWIYLPKAVAVYTSKDGSNWNNIAETSKENKAWPNQRKITINLPASTSTQYVKIIAFNHGIIAAGRSGEGRNAWLFVDEIEIE